MEHGATYLWPLVEPPPEEWASCSLCHVCSPLRAAFRSTRRHRCLCPTCYQSEQSRSQRGALLTVAFWIALGAAAVLLGGKGNAGWVFLNFALLHLMQWVTVIPHEVGHALAARAMGLEVLHIVIGVGPRLGSWRIAGTCVDLHLFPLSGATVCAVRDQAWARLRRLCIVAGGPLVNLLLMWAAIELGRAVWLAERIDRGPAPMLAFIAANCIVLLVNLWPSAGAAGPSDGAQLLGLLFTRRVDFAALQRRTALYRVELAAQRGNPDAAIAGARAALREYPGDTAFQVALSAGLLGAQHFGGARELLVELMQEPAHPADVRVVLQNNLACANLNLDDPALGAEAKVLAAQAHRWMPWEPCVIANLGCAEALFGDAASAIELLNNPRIAAHSPQLASAAASALALAHARLGQHQASEAALITARACDPRSNLLQVVERRLMRISHSDRELRVADEASR